MPPILGQGKPSGPCNIQKSSGQKASKEGIVVITLEDDEDSGRTFKRDFSGTIIPKGYFTSGPAKTFGMHICLNLQ